MAQENMPVHATTKIVRVLLVVLLRIDSYQTFLLGIVVVGTQVIVSILVIRVDIRVFDLGIDINETVVGDEALLTFRTSITVRIVIGIGILRHVEVRVVVSLPICEENGPSSTVPRLDMARHYLPIPIH